MSYNSKTVLKDAKGNPVPQQFNPADDNYQPLQVMEYYGPTVSSRPAANLVPVGAVFCAVQSQEYWQSDGTQWVVI